jgi:hypothetical protein
MSIYRPTPGNRAQAVMIPVAQPKASTQAPAPAIGVPNAPAAPLLVQGSGSDLTVTWTAPAVDNTHSAATGFNLRFSPSEASSWTILASVTSPYDLFGLTAGASFDVQVQAVNAAGASVWSATSTLTTASGVTSPNAPTISSVAPPPDGTNSKLTIAWTAPATDGNHSAATGYNLRYSPSGAGTWTTVPGVTSPYSLTGLSGGAAIDVEVQAVNAAVNPGAWSGITTGTTWGATVAAGNLAIALTQASGTSVAPGGGANLTATPAPTEVTGTAFAWSTSAFVPPTTNLIAATSDGQTNGWGQYFNAPATAGNYYLWMLAQGAGGATIGALVSAAVTVS